MHIMAGVSHSADDSVHVCQMLTGWSFPIEWFAMLKNLVTLHFEALEPFLHFPVGFATVHTTASLILYYTEKGENY